MEMMDESDHYLGTLDRFKLTVNLQSYPDNINPLNKVYIGIDNDGKSYVLKFCTYQDNKCI